MWEFASIFAKERRERLLSHSGFDAVIALVATGAQVVAFDWELFGAQRLLGCNRASFLLRVSEVAYDAFFNSPAGYRGQFARSTDTGEKANRALLSALEQLLLANPGPEQASLGPLVVRSLRAGDAKCWIFEQEVEQHMGGIVPEIVYAPWQRASEDGAGLRAPLGAHLEGKGGWLDPQGVERRDAFKSSRSGEIHDVGYS